MFIGGTTLVVESYRPEERANVQPFKDFTVFVAIARFSSGAIQSLWGWDWINTAMLLPTLIVLTATVWLRLHNRRAAAAG